MHATVPADKMFKPHHVQVSIILYRSCANKSIDFFCWWTNHYEWFIDYCRMINEWMQMQWVSAAIKLPEKFKEAMQYKRAGWGGSRRRPVCLALTCWYLLAWGPWNSVRRLALLHISITLKVVINSLKGQARCVCFFCHLQNCLFRIGKQTWVKFINHSEVIMLSLNP